MRIANSSISFASTHVAAERFDEADAVCSKLQVWSKSGTTDERFGLKERNVGAIYLGQAATPFELKDGANQLQGAVRASGVYVKEDGSGVGSVQQIDLAV
jgi:hypothetical protein